MKKTNRLEGYIYFVGFIASIWFANWLLTHWGTVKFPDSPYLIPVLPAWANPFGGEILAPSGVLAIGLSFTLRDLVQRRLGWRFAFVGIVIGAGLSAFLDPQLAVASCLAFLFAETLDLFVYTPLQRRNLPAAVVGSNIVGIVVDSTVFLLFAFGSLAHLDGQIIGKAWMTLFALPLIYALRAWDERRGIVAYDDLQRSGATA